MVDRETLRTEIRNLLEKENLWDSSLETELPHKWERHGNCVLFCESVFKSPAWSQVEAQLYPLLCGLMRVEKIARRRGSITPNDLYRRPQVELLHGGADPWISRTENGIKFKWDVTRSMFSSGNISEKQRISSWNLSGQTVVDLYAGIGYFTLSYLVHSKAQLVYAIEWNPAAVKALRINVKLNKVEERCVIVEGDNAEVCPRNVADHVNLGLIPTSEASWPAACASLRADRGGVLHIHGNVDLKDDFIPVNFTNNYSSNGSCCTPQILFSQFSSLPSSWCLWAGWVRERIHSIIEEVYPSKGWTCSIMEIVKVKSYGPCVDHLVVDIMCEPGHI